MKEIKNTFGEKLDYEYHETSSPWVVIVAHGVTAHKERPLVQDTIKGLREAGFSTLHFSFAGNGQSEGAFTDATISKELGDLQAVLNFLEGKKRIAYIGHSMGGAVGVLTAATDTRIELLISHAGMVDTKAFYEVEFGSLTPDQDVMWEEESCPLSSAFQKDLCETIVSTLPQVKKISQPWLLLHGTEDDVVLIKDSEAAHAAHPASTFIKIEGGDHIFNAPAREKLIAETVTWLKEKTKI